MTAVATLDDFGPQLLDALTLAIPYDHATYNELDEPAQRVRFLEAPARADAPSWGWETYARYLPENPFAQHVINARDGSARRVSDFLSQDELHELGLYRHVFAPLGIEYQLCFTLPCRRPLFIGVALSRSTCDFTDDECELASALRPHLLQAYRSVQLFEQYRTAIDGTTAALDASGRGVVVLDGDAAVAMGAAADMLARHFGAADADRLPEPVARWLANQRTRHGVATAEVAAPLVSQSGDRRLMVRYVPRAAGERELLVLDEREQHDAAPLRQLGLTPREAEILWWLARGVEIPQIARRIGVRDATVRKHLERVYRKLGVSNRAAATAQAIDALHWDVAARP